MDRLEQLYNLYVDKGILTSKTTLDQFKESDVDIQSKLYDLGKNKGLFNTTDLNTFQSAWGDVKKKDSSAFQNSISQKTTEDSVLESEPSTSSSEYIESLNESIRKRRLSSEQGQDALDLDRESKRPFYEGQGVDINKVLDAEFVKSQVAEKKEQELEQEKDLGFFSKLYKRITDTSDLEEDYFTTDEDVADEFLAKNSDKIFEAEKQFHNAQIKDVIDNIAPESRMEQIEARGIDLSYMPVDNIKVNNESVSVNELQKNLFNTDFVNDVIDGKTTVTIDNPDNDEGLKTLQDLLERQVESGGFIGDWAESFAAGALDLLVAGPLEIAEGLLIGGATSDYEQIMYNTRGGKFASKVKKTADKIRERTRLYQEDGMTSSILKGNFLDAFKQGGSAIAETMPLIFSMYASSPTLATKFGPKAAQNISLGAIGLSTAGVQSLSLKEQRMKGEIDVNNFALYANAALTGAAEAVFEKTTLDLVNDARALIGRGKSKQSAKEIADNITDGFFAKGIQEGGAEFKTEVSNTITNMITGVDKNPEDVLVRLSDSFLIGFAMGGGIHSAGYLGKAFTDADYKKLNDNIVVNFIMEDKSTKQMSRAEALRFVKTEGVGQQIRDGKIKMDASMNAEAQSLLDELVFGFYAPDAAEARGLMQEKEKVVNNMLNVLDSKKKSDISIDEISALNDAVSQMESEGKKSKYNVTDRTKSIRERLGAVLNDKGIQVIDPMTSQDTSGSNITESVEATEIKTQEQYESVKSQIDKGKRKPVIVTSQDKSGIVFNNNKAETSNITTAKFNNVSDARNALKDYEAKMSEGVNKEDLFKANNKLFINTSKDNLDQIPQDVINSNDYHILTSDRGGVTEQEKASRMEKLKSMLNEAGATYYTVQGVYNSVAEESLLVTGLSDASALNIGNQFQQESIFSSKTGFMYNDGRIEPLDPKKDTKGPDARKQEGLTILNINGRKTSISLGTDKLRTSYGKNFNSENVHKLDPNNPKYDSDLFEGVTEARKEALGFALKLLNSIGNLNVTVIKNSNAMAEQLKSIGQDPSKNRGSFFRGADKTIYVNLETVRGNTLFHEIIHPMVDFIKKTDADLYKRIESEVKESDMKRRVIKDGRRMKGSYLDWAKSNYEGLSEEALIEEAFAEMMGDAAYGHFVNKQSKLTKIREVIRAILERLNIVSPVENVESIDLQQMSLKDLADNLSGALVNGRKITVGGVEFEVGDVDKLSEIRKKNPTLLSEPNPETADISKSYLSDKATDLGIDQYSEPRFVNRLNEDNSKMIADAYDSLVDDPKNPEVIKAYKALADETLSQYQSIIDKGYKLEIWKGKGEPYANSTEMIQDVRDNKHLYIFGTEAGFGEGAITPEQRKENVMLSRTEYKDVNGDPLVVNDIFRFVHDFFGHTELGNGFGPIGEENAWLNHSRMYSPEARKAMTTETRGQNSWVNYNKNLRKKDGTIPKKGEKGYVPLSKRPFADQKMGILPDNIVNPVDVKAETISDIRMQPFQKETESVVYTSGLGNLIFDVSQSVIDLDYKLGEWVQNIPGYTTLTGEQEIDARLSTLLLKPKGTHTDKEIKELMTLRKGDVALELHRANEIMKRFADVNKEYQMSDSELNDLLGDVNKIKAMESDKSDMKGILMEMRRHIDSLSRTLIDEGLIRGQASFAVEANGGFYITRSYKQFENKSWKQTDTDIQQRAKDFLYQEVKKENPDLSESEIKSKSLKIYNRLIKKGDFSKYSSANVSFDGLTRVNSIFKKRKIVPQEIRDLWGEIDNPVFNYNNTISKIARTVAAERMYKDLLDIGQGKFIFDDAVEGVAENELTESKFGLLEGKFIDNEMFNVLNRFEEKVSYPLLLTIYMESILLNKKAKTVWNLPTHFINLIGNTSFALMNGHVSFKNSKYFATEAIKSVSNMTDPQVKEFREKLIKLRVIDNSATLSEIQSITEQVKNSNFSISEYVKNKDFTNKGAIGYLSKIGKKLDNWATDAYQAEDNVWKAYGFLSEKARYLEAGFSVEDAEATAAKNVRNLYPNYNEIPRIIRTIGRSPVVGSFVAFQAESVRNTKNAIMLGFEEISSDNPVLKKSGVARLSGTLATFTLLQSMQLYTAKFFMESFFGEDEDDEQIETRKIRTILPSWDAKGLLSYTEKGELESRYSKGQKYKDRYIDYINFSRVSGVGYIKDLFRLAFTDIKTEPGKKSFMRILEAIYEPFLTEEMTLTLLQNAYNNKGGKVYNETDGRLTKLFKSIEFVGKGIAPGTLRTGVRIGESVFEEDSELVPLYEVLAIFGLRVNRINVNKSVYFRSRYANKKLSDIVGKDVMKDESKLRGFITKGSEDYDSRADEVLNKFADIISAARLNNIAGEDIRQILRKAGMSNLLISIAEKRGIDRYHQDNINILKDE